MNAEFVFDRMCAQVVARADRAVGIEQKFWHQNREMPRVPGGASGSRASTKWMMFSVRSCSP